MELVAINEFLIRLSRSRGWSEKASHWHMSLKGVSCPPHLPKCPPLSFLDGHQHVSTVPFCYNLTCVPKGKDDSYYPRSETKDQ